MDDSKNSTHNPQQPPEKNIQTRRWHRIKSVRREQGFSIRRVAHQMQRPVEELRVEEDEQTDLRLSELYVWQKMLEVPAADLLVDPDQPLSPPVMQRARLVRLMKTVAAIQQKSQDKVVQRLTKLLMRQLLQIMPELEGVTPWHSIGNRRTLDEYGRIIERSYSVRVTGGDT